MSYTFPQTDLGKSSIPGIDKAREEGTSYAVAIVERIRSLGITDVDSRAIDERPADATVDEVSLQGDKLVVMGPHGRSGSWSLAPRKRCRRSCATPRWPRSDPLR